MISISSMAQFVNGYDASDSSLIIRGYLTNTILYRLKDITYYPSYFKITTQVFQADRLDNTHNDGTPTTILWASNGGEFRRSPLSSIYTGSTSQYIRGDGSLATFAPGGVTSIGITSSDLTISGSPVTTSGNITANLSTTGVGAGTYESVTVDTKGRITAATNPTRSFASVSRSLVTTTSSTGFQISASVDYAANYSVYAQVSSALIGTNTADVFLEIATTNSTTPGDWTTISRSGISCAGVLATSGNTQTVGGFIPAGYYVRLRTLPTGTNSGSAVFTYQVGQENSY